MLCNSKENHHDVRSEQLIRLVKKLEELEQQEHTLPPNDFKYQVTLLRYRLYSGLSTANKYGIEIPNAVSAYLINQISTLVASVQLDNPIDTIKASTNKYLGFLTSIKKEKLPSNLDLERVRTEEVISSIIHGFNNPREGAKKEDLVHSATIPLHTAKALSNIHDCQYRYHRHLCYRAGAVLSLNEQNLTKSKIYRLACLSFDSSLDGNSVKSKGNLREAAENFRRKIARLGISIKEFGGKAGLCVEYDISLLTEELS